jgi:rubrerythrin
LKAAADGEQEEHTKLYPHFAEVAQQEGFAEIAKAFRTIALVEKHLLQNVLHANIRNHTSR